MVLFRFYEFILIRPWHDIDIIYRSEPAAASYLDTCMPGVEMRIDLRKFYSYVKSMRRLLIY
jgi:hypothetical protein